MEGRETGAGVGYVAKKGTGGFSARSAYASNLADCKSLFGPKTRLALRTFFAHCCRLISLNPSHFTPLLVSDSLVDVSFTRVTEVTLSRLPLSMIPTPKHVLPPQMLSTVSDPHSVHARLPPPLCSALIA